MLWPHFGNWNGKSLFFLQSEYQLWKSNPIGDVEGWNHFPRIVRGT
jgi:hypothetical protein